MTNAEARFNKSLLPRKPEGSLGRQPRTSTSTVTLLLNSGWFSVALRPQRRVGLLGTGTEWEGGERVKGSTAETARKRPERPWTAARTMEVLRRCPLAIAQRLVHCAIALSTAVLDRVTKTMSVAPLLTNNLDNSKQKTSNLLSPAPPPYSWSLLGIVERPAPPPSSKISRSFDLAWNPEVGWKGRGRLYTYRYTVTDFCIKVGDESHFNVSHDNCEEQSHKTVSTDHNFWRQRRAEADSNRGPSEPVLNWANVCQVNIL